MLYFGDLIPSKDVREYVDKVGKRFTDIERASMYYNNPLLSIYQKMERLICIMTTTVNEKLKRQIRERLDFEKRSEESFYNNDKKDHVYVLETYCEEDEEYEEKGIFFSGNLAVEYGKTYESMFRIYKKKILSSADDNEDDCGFVLFNKYGELMDLCVVFDEGYDLDSEINEDRFERYYVDIPHPFKAGDFVKIIGDLYYSEDNVCLVETHDREYKERPRITKVVIDGKERTLCRDINDSTMTVSKVHDDACFSHSHPFISCIEFAEVQDDDAKRMILYCAQSVLRGGGLDCLQTVCNEYRRKKNID